MPCSHLRQQARPHAPTNPKPGVVIYGLSKEAAAAFGEVMRARQVHKVYYALVRGFTNSTGGCRGWVGGWVEGGGVMWVGGWVHGVQGCVCVLACLPAYVHRCRHTLVLYDTILTELQALHTCNVSKLHNPALL